MITVKIGNLLLSNAQTWVNTVNCVGVMGKGIALEFKQRFPEMFKEYAARCERGDVRLGEPYSYRLRQQTQNMFAPDTARRHEPEIIVNFPTKDHWRAVSRLSDIVAGLDYLVKYYREWGIKSIAVPPLGCGHGQLEWRVVGPTLFRHLKRLEIPVEIYAPHETLHEELTSEFLSGEGNGVGRSGVDEGTSKINPAWVTLAQIVARVEEEPYHWQIGRTTFQKIAFFATTLGLPTGLQFRRASYGPFSEELKPLLTRLVNNGILVERQNGKMFSVEAGRTYLDAVRVYAGQLQQWEPIVERVADLFLRLQTKDAEVAATVYFVGQELARRGGQPSELDVLLEVKQWKQKRRPPLDEEEIARTIRKLNILRWMNVKPSKELPLPEDEFEHASETP